jgi:ribosomal protein S18 acetylase RimI-like enzyme
VVTQICTAPGAVAYVALAGDRLVGWAQAVGDGVLQSHLSFLAVHPDHRRRGIGRLLVMATFQATGTKRMDLVTDPEASRFYERFAHKSMAGFRLYPGAQV